MAKTPLEANFYVDVCTRAELSHSVSYFSRYLNSPTPQLCRASNRVIRYLLNRKAMRLKLGGTTFPYLRVFGDSDWAGCRDTRRSIGSILVFVGDCVIHWIVGDRIE